MELGDYPFKFWEEVEVLGFDGEPKYIGVFAGRGEDDRSFAVYNDDTGEVHFPPKDHVRKKGATE